MKPFTLLVCILVLFTALCTPLSAKEDAVPKAVVLDLSMRGGAVHVTGSYVVNNYPPDNRATDKIKIRMLDQKGALLLEQGIDDPRVAYVDEGVVIRDNVNFSVIVPFDKDLATIRLVNGSTGAEMLSYDVSGSVNGYCREHGSDPDCAAFGLQPLMPAALIIVVVLLLAGAGWFLLRKKGASEPKQAGP